MPSFTGKTFSNFYKNLLGINQSSNTGVDATTRTVQDGAGNNTAISLSDDVLQVQPQTDDTTGAVLVKNKGGTNLFVVDTTNSLVKAGTAQVNVLTNTVSFGVHDANSSVAGTHYIMSAGTLLHASGAGSFTPPALGTGTNPSTSLTITTDAVHEIATYWMTPFAITLDEVTLMARCEGDTTMNFHLMSFDVVTGAGSTSGNLSNGVYNATSGTTDPDSLSPIVVENDRVSISNLTIENANIANDKIMIATFENVGGTDDVSVHLQITYHAQ